MNGIRNRIAHASMAFAFVAVLSFGAGSQTVAAQSFAPIFNMSSLNGVNGFRLDGGAIAEWSSYSVGAAGDINGDGIDDMVIGAPFADSGPGYAGRVYVVFGQTINGSFLAKRWLSSLDGSNGFRMDGVSYVSKLGMGVSSAGDINGDGLDDLVVGAPESGGGLVHVVFGRANGSTFPALLPLSSLDGSSGFTISGSDSQQLGWSTSSAGDLNSDGIDDLIIGAPGFTKTMNSGSAYVVFGRSSGTPFNSTMSVLDLNGDNGFRIVGGSVGEGLGHSVSAVGDVNGDGLDDVIIGAPFAHNADWYAGSSYVLFGRTSTATFDSIVTTSSLDGTTGFRLDGEDAEDRSGWIVSKTGDVNGDRIDDMAIGDFSHSMANQHTGKSYVVFGRAGSMSYEPVLSLSQLDGQNGFRIDGAGIGDFTGSAVSGAGDVNGDGVNDIIVGADKTAASGVNPAATYVVFGRRSQFSFPPALQLSALDGNNGFRMDPEAIDDSTGRSVSAAGDVNHDGIDDIIVGAPLADSFDTSSNSGSSYVVYGNDTIFANSFN